MRTAVVILVVFGVTAGVWAQEQAPEIRQCSICHGKREFKKVQPDGSVRPLFVDERVLAGSVHARWHCLDCHADITAIPHPAPLPKVNCQRCHFPGNPVGAPEEVNYQGYLESVHGRPRRAGNLKAPACQFCHGGHDVKKEAILSRRFSRLTCLKPVAAAIPRSWLSTANRCTATVCW